MRHFAYIFSVLGCIALFAAMMSIKADVGLLVDTRARLAQKNLHLQEDLRVLKAEISYLTSPERLTQLAQEQGFHLMTMEQILPEGLTVEAPAW